MAKTFGMSEHFILSLFAPGTNFFYGGASYAVVESGKPTCPFGEPKTDIYILAVDVHNNYIELKISFKQSNANFLENKTNSERAEQLLGCDWQNIISNATWQLRSSFLSKPLVYKTGFAHTDAGAITLGWKFELLNVKSGQLSASMNLTEDQVIDVYSGSNLSQDKQNAYVNGRVIPFSGCANTILFEDQPITSAQAAIDNLIPVEEYVALHPDVFFACKALNYRSFECKYDGNRPLSVFVDWSVQNNKLHPELVFDHPLEVCGDAVCDKLLQAMRYLDIRTTDDINRSNIDAPSVVFG